MKAIVFGATGFIGSHVVEQLHAAGHDVTAAVRCTSNTLFLERLGVPMVTVDFDQPSEISIAIRGHDTVYNCTADAKLDTSISLDAAIEVKLTRTLAETSALLGVSRFIQLSTIVLYDFRTGEPMDEAYPTQPEFPIQQLALAREAVVSEVAAQTGLDITILRPASAIGPRDITSFFSRLFGAYSLGTFPLIKDGSGKVSLVDTRDIGRAMVWLGTSEKPERDPGVYLLKGFDTTWQQLKDEIDRCTGTVAPVLSIPEQLTAEQMASYRVNPFMVKSFTVDRIWNDNKIRASGFRTMYSLRESVATSVQELMNRSLSAEKS
ncbi:NAD-dependent epimerase/dehydratase family protein [Brevibacillus fluminis]|uniref:NAD-dependent epimerase/dehydratase family protein n=1 Tax=Brevibacillus fluminis TaxID=511487 RepID=UPI003F89FF7E